MNLIDKRGFFFRGKWYPAGSRDGHEETAFEIIKANRNCSSEDWNWTIGSAQDYLVVEKRAIQVGCASRSRVIIVSGRYYNESDMINFKYSHGIEQYDVQYIW